MKNNDFKVGDEVWVIIRDSFDESLDFSLKKLEISSINHPYYYFDGMRTGIFYDFLFEKSVDLLGGLKHFYEIEKQNLDKKYYKLKNNFNEKYSDEIKQDLRIKKLERIAKDK